MVEGPYARRQNDKEDTLLKDEFYLDLVTQIHRKEEADLLACPSLISERLEMLGLFSNEVLDVARVLAERFKGRDQPGETHQLDLDEYVDTRMFSDPPTPVSVEGDLGSPLADAEINREEVSTCSMFTSQVSDNASEDHEAALRRSSGTLDPRRVFLEQQDYQISTDHIGSAFLPTQTPDIALSMRRKRSDGPQDLTEAPATKRRRVVCSKPFQGNISTQKDASEYLNIPIRIAKAIASPTSIKQLKGILKTTRSNWSPTATAIPNSTKGLWRYLHSLDASNHGSSLRRRIALYRLKLHYDSLLLELKARKKGSTSTDGPARSEVLDIMIAETSDGEDESPIAGPSLRRESLKEQLHRAKIWHTFCERFGVGILFLIPISEGRGGLSNNVIERVTLPQIEVCFNYISQHREHIVGQAATKAAVIMPLFEGKPCKIVLKLEDEKKGDFREDTDTSMRFLELLEPKP